jgi:hypothetical protein
MNGHFAMRYIIGRVRRMWYFTLAPCLFFVASQAFAQSYVGRFEVYEGSMYLNSPRMSLGEPGYHIQAGMRARRWLSFGFDYSRGTGNTSLTAPVLVGALQKQLNAAISSGELPANYRLSIPIGTVTQTFAMGPQFPYRRFNKVTLFIRPTLGAVKEVATTHPADVVGQVIVQTYAPTGKLEDWTKFYGVGGGASLNFSKRFSLVVQADFVHDNLFNNILADRNTVRLSIGPGYQFGRNVTR